MRPGHFEPTGNLLGSISLLVYQDDEHLIHLFEHIHFGLFFVMLSFGLLAFWLLIATFAAWRKWHLYEHFATLHSRYVETPESRLLPRGARVRHKKHGDGVIDKVLQDGQRLVLFDCGASHRYNSHQWSKLTRLDKGARRNSVVAANEARARDRSRSRRTHTHTCLLYTSPSPRDRQKSRMPSSA